MSTFIVRLLCAGPCPVHQLYSKESDKDPGLMKFTCPYGRVAISTHNSGCLAWKLDYSVHEIVERFRVWGGSHFRYSGPGTVDCTGEAHWIETWEQRMNLSKSCVLCQRVSKCKGPKERRWLALDHQLEQSEWRGQWSQMRLSLIHIWRCRRC